MRELETIKPGSLDETQKSRLMLLAIDESSIHCKGLRELEAVIAGFAHGIILAMPDYEYQRGLRGWAKAHIIAAVCSNVAGVMPLGQDEIKQELWQAWGRTERYGDMVWTQTAKIKGCVRAGEAVVIEETDDETDVNLAWLAKQIISASNCWLDPAGAVFARGGKIEQVSVSTSYNNSECTRIPIDFNDLGLKPWERMQFCDSIHAEREGISEAARNGTPLDGTTMYISKFPCRDCARSVIAAGVKRVVFEKDSYGLPDAQIFVENGVELNRVKTD